MLHTYHVGGSGDPITLGCVPDGTSEEVAESSVGVATGARWPWRRISIALAVGFALMVLALGVYAWTVQPLGGEVRRGSAIDPGAVVSGATGASTPAEISSAQPPMPVPSGLRTWSVSNAGSGSLFALGAADCDQDVCPVLLRSSDNGTSWTAVHTFEGTDTSSARGDFVPFVQPDRAITQTRFAGPQTGYVFGGDLWITRDRGQTFTRMTHVGQTVLDVEIEKDTVAVLSSDGCVQGTCTGPVYLSLASPNDNAIRTTTATLTPTVAVSAGSIVLRAGVPSVQLGGSATGPFASYRLDAGRLVPTTGPAACRGTGLHAMTAAADQSGVMYAVCAPTMQGDETSYTLVRSTDGGRGWTAVSVGALRLASIGQLSLTAPHADALVASCGGPRGDVGFVPAGEPAVVRSDDSGRTFRTPKTPPTSTTGFDEVSSPGASEVYATPRTGGGYWTSEDDGDTWRYLDPKAG